MSPLIGVLILVLLGLLGARVAFDPARTPLGPRLFLATGSHFLLLGLVLGPLLGLLTLDVIEQVQPFMALGLGWIGLLFGLQLDRRQLRQFPPSYLLFALLQAGLTFALFFGLGYLGFRLAGPPGAGFTAAILAAAATAAVSTPAGVALVSRTFMAQGKLVQLLFYVASIDAIVGISALQLTYALHHPSTRVVAGFGWGVWLGIAAAAGFIFGVFFLWLTRPKPERDELTLFLLGLVVFEAGTALYLGVSPLFVAAITGVVVGNLSPSRRRVYSILQAWEKPIYVILLILAGALISISSWIVLPLAAGYLVLRAGAKVAAGAATRQLVRLPFPLPPEMGIGLISQGGISLAMALSATLTYGATAGPRAMAIRIAFTTIVIAVTASELIGPFLTRDLLRRAGEITTRTETALAEAGN
ncbi:MAG TPA: cation:proton antiporter [Longimicrobiales bacterium]|nr:cation:proton antiporter [Longimicrobiales bacterium]